MDNLSVTPDLELHKIKKVDIAKTDNKINKQVTIWGKTEKMIVLIF